MISPSTVSSILDAARIEEVVGMFVNLKKRGNSLIGLCPFHNEKSPSFNVNIARGIFKCFGCGKGGDSVNFLMEHEKFTYPEALRFLAEKYQIPVEETQTSVEYKKENDDRESLYILNNFAKETFQNNLKEPEGKTIGLTYFLERGFREETIQNFELGYAIEAKADLSEKALKYGFKEEFLEKSGLAFKTDSGSLMDRFRGRVMFPIHNQSGKVIAFGGRILKSSEKTAKYINSPETEFYQKSEVLYGLFQAKKAIRNLDRCLLAEGYTDVISLHQSGIENVVSSSGTSLTKGQIKLISRFTQNITILYDGDAAGIKASLRGIDLLLEEGLYVKIVLFPDNQDPDSYIRKVGGAAFSQYIEAEQKDFIAFKTNLLLKEAQGDPIKKAALVHDILESIAKVPDSVLASVYTRECSDRLEIEERTLLIELNKIRIQKSKNTFNSGNENSGQSVQTGPFGTTGQTGPNSQTGPSRQNDPTQASNTNYLNNPNSVSSAGELSSQPTPVPQENSANPILDAEGFKDDGQEEEILRILLNYGSVDREEGLTVAQDIIIQITDTGFENPLYKAFYELIVEQVKTDPKLDPRPFIQSRNPQIKNLAVKLLSQKYSLSENWQNRHGIEVKREEDLIIQSVESSINHLKKRKIDTMIKENQDRLRTATSHDEISEIQSIHQILSSARTALSNALGVVVLK